MKQKQVDVKKSEFRGMLELKVKIARILHLIFWVGGKENLQIIMFSFAWLEIY